MKPHKIGQIAKYHTPLPGENPNQLYVVLEIFDDAERPQADIKALNTGLPFPPINTAFIHDLEVVAVDNSDLIGHRVTINKADSSKATGRVVKVDAPKIIVDLKKEENGVSTNILLPIEDYKGEEHIGTLFVKHYSHI
ncbi:MAG: hypothetical protein KDC83_14570 [Flavobacteriales bacterium]|nr:hypothetical protein [Flavobacteriales bacterium]